MGSRYAIPRTCSAPKASLHPNGQCPHPDNGQSSYPWQGASPLSNREGLRNKSANVCNSLFDKSKEQVDLILACLGVSKNEYDALLGCNTVNGHWYHYTDYLPRMVASPMGQWDDHEARKACSYDEWWWSSFGGGIQCLPLTMWTSPCT